MKVRPHKLGSVVHRVPLPREVEFSRQIDARVGTVLVVKALEEKRVYDVMELTTGRMAHISKGDVIVGALGRRGALRGFVGRVPVKVMAGVALHVLNLGCVLGEATSENKDVGHPLKVEVLGMVTMQDKPVNIADWSIPDPDPRTPIPPVIAVSGTCMNAGKTLAACELITSLTDRGYVCAGVKLTGVAAMKDTLNMSDHGAVAVMNFVDCGLPSTVGVDNVAPIAKKILRSIEKQAKQELDVVVAEMGDGIIGAYGVDSILGDEEFRGMIKAHVLCANDLVAAWGGVRWMKERGLKLDVIAGPATDNSVGTAYIENELGLGAGNARTDPSRFVDLVEEAAFPGAT
ncbi:MAG: hypothetical protein ACKOSS_08825 [Planctomycetia bacterium]